MWRVMLGEGFSKKASVEKYKHFLSYSSVKSVALYSWTVSGARGSRKLRIRSGTGCRRRGGSVSRL